MSAEHPKVDPQQLATVANAKQAKHAEQAQEMQLARANSSTAHQLAIGVQNVKGEKTEAKAKSTLKEVGSALPAEAAKFDELQKEKAHTKELFSNNISASLPKEAVKHEVRTQQKIHDMAKAEEKADAAHALVGEIRAIKGEKVEAKSKDQFAEVATQIPKAAAHHDLRTHAQYETIAKADEHAQTTQALVDGVRAHKGEKVEAKSKENFADVAAHINKQ